MKKDYSLPASLVNLLEMKGYRILRSPNNSTAKMGVVLPGSSTSDYVADQWLEPLTHIAIEDIPLYMACPNLIVALLDLEQEDIYCWHDTDTIPFLQTLLELHQEGLWPPQK